MSDGRTRVASKREPITTTVEVDDKVLVFQAKPIPRWRARNEFGNTIVALYTKAMNSFVHGYNEGDDFLLTGELFEHAMPYDQLFDWGYGSYDDYSVDNPKPEPASPALHEQFELLDFDSMVIVLEAALEINGLESNAYMLDPRKKDLSLLTSLANSNGEDGQKMESSVASG